MNKKLLNIINSVTDWTNREKNIKIYNKLISDSSILKKHAGSTFIKNEVALYSDIIYVTKNYKIHNDKGPAILYKNGDIYYVKNNDLHNLNGPAAIWFHYDMVRYDFYIEDKLLTEQEFMLKIAEIKGLTSFI